MDLRETSSRTVNRHPWELARVTALQLIAKAYQIPQPETRILDLGCGDGFLIDTLCPEHTWPIDAVDIHLTEEQLAVFSQARPRLTFHNSYQSIAGNQYGLFTLFDVLEHVEDDVNFLKETCAQFAAPKARMFCTVPAFPSLFCSHDTFLKHHRRYSRRDLQLVLTAAGLRVVASGYMFGSLLPARAFTVVQERLMGTSNSCPGIGNWGHGHFLTSIIQSLLDADNRALLWLRGKGITIPGLTVWALCETQQ
jgi:hypothetical protein